MKSKFKALIWIGVLVAALIYWWPFEWKPSIPSIHDSKKTKINVEHSEKTPTSNLQLDSLRLMIVYLGEENQKLKHSVDSLSSVISECRRTVIVKDEKVVVKETPTPKKIVTTNNTTTQVKTTNINVKSNTKKNEKSKIVPNPIHSYDELSKFLTDRYKDTIK